MLRIKNFDLRKGTDVFKAFGDESRIRIIHLIYKTQEMCISDLELILDFTQTKTSRHLSYLRNAGLVRFKKRDQWVYYYINDSHYDIIVQLLSFLEKDVQLTKDIHEYRTLYSNNELAIRQLHTKQNKYKLPSL